MGKTAKVDETLYLNVRNQIIQGALRALATWTGAMPLRLRVAYTDNPLQSATLFANFQRQRLVRAGEQMTPGQVRSLLNISDAKYDAWSWIYQQLSSRRPQYDQAIADLHRQERISQAKLDIEDDAESKDALMGHLTKLAEGKHKLQSTLEMMEPVLKGSMHPDPGALIQSTDGGHASSLMVGANSPWRMRGVMVRIAGAKKGERAQSWKKYAGAYSMNSVDYVDAEEAKVQMLTKYGTYGLTVRLVRQLCADMPRLNRGAAAISKDGLAVYEPFRVGQRLHMTPLPKQ